MAKMANLTLNTALAGSAFVASHMTASTIEARMIDFSPFRGFSLLCRVVGFWGMGSRFWLMVTSRIHCCQWTGIWMGSNGIVCHGVWGKYKSKVYEPRKDRMKVKE
jgi:hypothetical protein